MVQCRWSDKQRLCLCLKVHRHFFNRGSKSRNKVAVGEPAAGSFFRSKQKQQQQKNIRKNLKKIKITHILFFADPFSSFFSSKQTFCCNETGAPFKLFCIVGQHLWVTVKSNARRFLERFFSLETLRPVLGQRFQSLASRWYAVSTLPNTWVFANYKNTMMNAVLWIPDWWLKS